MSKLGDNYELFVQAIFRAILDSEAKGTQKNICVELKKKLKDNTGTIREFDIYWEYELCGFVYKTVIECKDYSSPVSIEKIDALVGKLKDLPGIRGIFATKNGYQRGAKTKAKQNNIELLVVREVNDDDFISPDGTPLIRKIHLVLQMCVPSQVLQFNPILDGKWISDNLGIDPRTIPLSQYITNNQVFIEDKDSDTEISLLDLSKEFIKPDGVQKNGIFDKHVEFKNAFIKYSDGTKYKIVGYNVKYMTFDPIIKEIEIDYAKEFLGVVEYLFNKSKKLVSKHGKIRTESLPEIKLYKKNQLNFNQ